MIGLRLKFLFVLTLFVFVLLSMIPFRYQLTDGSLTSSTNKSVDSNATANLTSSSSNNQTKPNSTMAITKSLQNNSKQDSASSSSIPVQNTSNLVITNPDQEEQELFSSSPSLPQQQGNEGIQLPILPTLPQPIQEPQLFSPPIYPQEPSVIQSELLFQSEPFAPAYPQAPSLIQSLQNLPTLAPSYPQQPSLIQLQQLLQNLPLAPQVPFYYQLLQPSYVIPSNPIFAPSSECQGQADCFRGIITSIVDGDTLDVNGIPIRLTLVDTPERGQSGYLEATNFVQSICGVGSEALVDEDDGQTGGSFGRLIGVIYCGGNIISLNELLIQGGFIDQSFCGISEFSATIWALRYGCGLVLQ